jgi:hypothetical protein
MKKKNVFAMVGMLALVAAGSFALSSCGSKAETFMIWGPEEHRDLYTQLGEEFKKANPGFPGNLRLRGKRRCWRLCEHVDRPGGGRYRLYLRERYVE